MTHKDNRTKKAHVDKDVSTHAIDELTADLQRTRADFENYRKNADEAKAAARRSGRVGAIMELLPVIDTIERATIVLPEDISDHVWVKGIAGIVKQLDGKLSNLGLARIDAGPGVLFDPELHQAVQVDEDSEGDHEVIAEELQPGYTLDGAPIRHAMVRVTRK